MIAFGAIILPDVDVSSASVHASRYGFGLGSSDLVLIFLRKHLEKATNLL